MSNKTAVEWVEDNIERDMDYREILFLIKHAKELETEQHLEKWQEGWDEAFDFVQHFKHQIVNIIMKKNEKK